MTYNGIIYRPPTEANTFLIPITEGCTHNSCHFCNMYQNIPFRMLPLSEVEKYLQIVKKSYGEYSEQIRRVYLVGADPFALSAKNLLERIDLICKYLPNAAVFTMYPVLSQEIVTIKHLIPAEGWAHAGHTGNHNKAMR